MSAGMPWIKLYTEMLDDPKIGRLEDGLKWRFVSLALLAGECDAEGYLADGDTPYSDSEIAWRLRIESDQMIMDLTELANAGLVEYDADLECWLVCKFSERQGRSQSEKRELWRERKRRQRNGGNDNNGTTTNVTSDNAENHDGVSPLEKEGEKEEDQEYGALGAPIDDLDAFLGTTPPENEVHLQARGVEERKNGIRAALRDFEDTMTADWREWGRDSKLIQDWRTNDPPRDRLVQLGYLLQQIDGRRPTWGNKSSVQTWQVGLVKLYRSCGGDFELVRQAVTKMRNDGLTRHDPHSYIATVESLRADAAHTQQRVRDDRAAWTPQGLAAPVPLPPNVSPVPLDDWRGAVAALGDVDLARWAWGRAALGRYNGGYVLVTAASELDRAKLAAGALRMPDGLPVEVWT